METDINSTEAEVRVVIRGYLSEVLRINADSVAGDDLLHTLHGADSVHLLRLVSKIERHWDIELDDEDVFGSQTLDRMAALVSLHLESR